MASEVIKWPSVLEMQEEATFREIRSGIPGIFGCVDGTKIKIDPPKNKDDYIDRKGHITVTMQGVCNRRKKFIDVNIGWAGSVHNSRVFSNSKLFDKLGNLPIGLRLLGDSAHQCLLQLLTPFKDNGHMTAAQTHFNKTFSREPIDIEHSFGLLKQRFRQLYYTKLKGIKTISHFVRACIVLHNLADEYDLPFEYADPDDPNSLDVCNDPAVVLPIGELPNGDILRTEICQHFIRNS